MTADGFGEPRKTPRLPNPIRFAYALWWSLNVLFVVSHQSTSLLNPSSFNRFTR
jgi:hypothetical protein